MDTKYQPKVGEVLNRPLSELLDIEMNLDDGKFLVFSNPNKTPTYQAVVMGRDNKKRPPRTEDEALEEKLNQYLGRYPVPARD